MFKKMNFFNKLKEKLKSLINKKNYNYNEKLIRLLEEQHKQLYNEFLKLKKFLEKKETKDKIKKQIDFIFENYKIHLILEDQNLYTYLKKVYNKNQKIANWISNKETEMGKITEFIKEKFNQIQKFNFKDNNDYYTSLKILEEIIYNLKKRITIEQEILYKFYVDYKNNNFNISELEKLIDKENEIIQNIK